MAEHSQKGKSHSWRPVGWKTYCLGCSSIQTVFSWCLGCNDMTVSPLNCWPLQCLDFLVTPLWRAPFTQECLPSCRSSSRAAVLRSWTQHHALWERKKAVTSRRVRKLRRNPAGNAVLAVGCAWELHSMGGMSRCPCWDEGTQELYITFFRTKSCWWPQQMCYFFCTPVI